MGKRLHLVGGDAPARELARAFAAGFAEPRTLGRGIGLGAYPDIVLGGLGVDRFHHLARFVGKRNVLLWGGCDGGHDVFSCRRAPGPSYLEISGIMPNPKHLIQRRLSKPRYG